MSLSVVLPAEMEVELRAQAARQGVDPAELSSQLLQVSLKLRAERRQQALKLWREWMTEAEQDDEPEDLEFYEQMNRNRAGERLLYPPELKGITW